MTLKSSRMAGYAATLVLAIAFAVSWVSAKSEVVDGRVVAIGDVHGDFEQMVRVLREAGLINKRKRWTGGEAILVQLGDIPDRGPDSRDAMDLLRKLESQARRAGGAVHVLIGNHESMLMLGDLRYTHPGEYASFATRNSQKLLDRYYAATVAAIKAATPEEEWPVFDAAHRKAWMAEHPKGYIELRQQFLPVGEYGGWVLEHDAVVKVGRSVFLHGGLSEAMLGMSIDEINAQVRSELSAPDSVAAEALVQREDGPLWYRGLARLPETPENEAMVDRILAAYDADRIVVGHTPRLKAVLPRFNGKVVVVDVGLSAHYGSGFGWLEINGGKPEIVHRGERLAVPTNREEKLAYLRRIEELEEKPGAVTRFINAWMTPPEPEPATP